MGRGELQQLLLNHTLTGHGSKITTPRNGLNQITDGQARQQSQQGNPAPRKGQGFSLQSPAAYVTLSQRALWHY